MPSSPLVLFAVIYSIEIDDDIGSVGRSVDVETRRKSQVCNSVSLCRVERKFVLMSARRRRRTRRNLGGEAIKKKAATKGKQRMARWSALETTTDRQFKFFFITYWRIDEQEEKGGSFKSELQSEKYSKSIQGITYSKKRQVDDEGRHTKERTHTQTHTPK